jgi:hypothetical protein
MGESEQAKGPRLLLLRKEPKARKAIGTVYQHLERPEPLFGHIFGDLEGFLVAFTGRQARLTREGARRNELANIHQMSFLYPDDTEKAASYLLAKAETLHDAYFGVHLFRAPLSRLASNAVPTVRCLWMDEDEGTYPEIGPDPTAIVASSSERRHLYWQLAYPVSVEWAVSMNRRIATWAGGDIGKAGLASVLRVPGTFNFKRYPTVDPVTLEFPRAEPWSPEIMEQAIPELPPLPTASSPSEPYDGPEMELAEFLDGVEVLGEVSDCLGRKLAIVCPWIAEHSGGDRTGTYVGHRVDGGLWFYCNHSHCQGRGWTEFRQTVRLKSKKLALVQKGCYA